MKTRKTDEQRILDAVKPLMHDPVPVPVWEPGDPDGDTYPINDEEGRRVADAFSLIDQELIVLSFNCHRPMLNALHEVKSVLERAEATVVFKKQYDLVCRAITQSEGGSDA